MAPMLWGRERLKIKHGLFFVWMSIWEKLNPNYVLMILEVVVFLIGVF